MTDDSGSLSSCSVAVADRWHDIEQASVQADFDSKDVTIDSVPTSECQRIFLVKEGRLLRGCLERVLQGPGRQIDSTCETLGALRQCLQGSGAMSPPADLVIASIDAQDVGAAFGEIIEMRRLYPAMRWIVVSHAMHIDFLRCAIACGVEGFLYEDSPVDVLRLVTDLVLLGHSLLPAELGPLLRKDLMRDGDLRQVAFGAQADSPDDDVERDERALAGRPSVSLSQRENEILRCLAQGYSNKVIARELLIAEATVKAHVKALLRKMQVVNRTQAAIAAPRFLRAMERRIGPGKSSFPAMAADLAGNSILVTGARTPPTQAFVAL